MEDCGIYCFENLVNGKKYIGQSIHLKRRFQEHTTQLRLGKHINIHLQGAWNTYGEENFSKYVLEYCEPDELDEKEIYWIDFYDTLNNGYNLSEGGNGIRGYKHTPEEIAKMIQIQKPRAVLQLTMDFEIVKEWPSASWAAKNLGFMKRTIQSVCDRINRQKTIGGFVWVYKDEYDNGTVDWDYYRNYNRNYPKPIIQMTLDGEFIKEWPCVCQAAKTFGVSKSSINGAIRRNGTCCGFRWKHKEENNCITE